VQAAGGGIAATSLTRYESAKGGTHTMVGGLTIQVFSMSIFLWLLLDFLWKIKYLRKGYPGMEFTPRYSHLRERNMFQFFPIVVVVGLVFVYIRSIYRVIELAKSWRGYLIVHEAYFMVLDALMIGLTCIIFIPYHPGIVLGREIIAVEGAGAHKKQIERGNETEDTQRVDLGSKSSLQS
jgi:hypothetical protein